MKIASELISAICTTQSRMFTKMQNKLTSTKVYIGMFMICDLKLNSSPLFYRHIKNHTQH